MTELICPLVYNGIATDPSGGYRPCCRFHTKDSFRGPLEEYRSSKIWKGIENDFLNNKWPVGCFDCEKNEQRSGSSKRIRELKNYKSKHKKEATIIDLQTKKYDLVDLRLSNKCNLGCMSCNPKSSSLIHDEVKNTDLPHMKHYENIYAWAKTKNLTTPYDDNEVDKLFESIDASSRIYFTGGEPSIVKGALKMLQRLIDSGLNKTVKLEFNSNFQTNNPKFIDLLSHFEQDCLMMPSIDAIGSKAEYIRYPSNWKQIEKNLQLFKEKCPSWNLRFSPTISILNVFYLHELAEYCEKNNFNYRIENILLHPDYFNVVNLPNKSKMKATEINKNVKGFDVVEKYMWSQPTSYQRLSACRTNIKKADLIRNRNYKEELPELQEVFKSLNHLYKRK
mgnify:CR=1 FL=1